MIGNRKYLLFTICIFFFACSTTKNIPEGDALYTGASVTLEAEGITSREQKVFTTDLEDLTRPQPNSRFLGIPIKLMIWNMLQAKKEESFFGKLRTKLGEPPVLLSDVDLSVNNSLLQNSLENKGFFTARVTGDTTVKGKKASAEYFARAGTQYKITSVEFIKDSIDKLTMTIAESAAESLLQVGRAFNLDVIKGERERIDAYLKERGFYYFNPDFLIIHADSSVGDHKVAMRVLVKNDVPEVARQVYFINDIFVYSNYSLNTARIDTNRANAIFHKGYYIIDAQNKFKPGLFERMMVFNSDEVYNRTDHNRSLRRLTSLNIFKFVKNRFEPVPRTDSNKLDVYYYLTPFPDKSIRAEVGAQTRSNNLNGTQVTLGFRHKNLFRAAELFDFKIYAGTEAQFSGSFQGHNTYRAGAEINFGIPRFVSPIRFNPNSSNVPRTNIQIGYELLNRKELYTLQSFKTNLGYSWRQSQTTSHEFYPISINYTLPANITAKYRDDMIFNPTIKHITDTQFILGSTYQYTLNHPAAGIERINSFYFEGIFDVSGNLAGLFVGKDNNNEKRLFNIPFAQYIKTQVDGRYYRRLGLKSQLANRIVIGYSAPYGNSSELPYIKQFFTGGNNSIRAFRSRTVGPGTYLAQPTAGGYIPDQTGDLKLELNSEYRPHLSGPLYGAIFVDAGNIWLKNENPLKPGAKFDKDFLKELAAGAGVGIRLDIQLFVLRFDIAFPIRKPWLPEGQRWVTNDLRFGDPDWRNENIIYNLAIGYPF